MVDNERDITVALLALKSFKPNLYDLVLIDIVMPGIDGLELYDRLRKIDPDIKACFLTASEMYHEEFRKAEHCSLNKDLFLQKPIPMDDLIMEINKRLN